MHRAFLAFGVVFGIAAMLSCGCCTFCNTGSLSGAKNHFVDANKKVEVDHARATL